VKFPTWLSAFPCAPRPWFAMALLEQAQHVRQRQTIRRYQPKSPLNDLTAKLRPVCRGSELRAEQGQEWSQAQEDSSGCRIPRLVGGQVVVAHVGGRSGGQTVTIRFLAPSVAALGKKTLPGSKGFAFHRWRLERVHGCTTESRRSSCDLIQRRRATARLGVVSRLRRLAGAGRCGWHGVAVCE